jgi:hypothetical protein
LERQKKRVQDFQSGVAGNKPRNKIKILKGMGRGKHFKGGNRWN